MAAIHNGAVPIKIGQDDSMSTPKAHSPTEMEKQNVINRQDCWMRQCWNRTLSEKLGIADHYSHVAVLIVRWVKELDDDLKCWEEASCTAP